MYRSQLNLFPWQPQLLQNAYSRRPARQDRLRETPSGREPLYELRSFGFKNNKIMHLNLLKCLQWLQLMT